ncbi:lysozyme [Streptomyces hygroscopicus]|uniref:lysozyme n=1 Tax=Streptomyces hygroscopicus TaxID=1912 RepID=UPI00206BE095|nr:lysozyme [Streptomyces hygroscopicus]
MPLSPLRRPPCAVRTAVRAALLTTLAAVTVTATLLTAPPPAHAAASVHGTGSATGAAAEQVPGMDVSRYQGTVDWQGAWANGARWAYVKATEGTTFQSPTFPEQFQGAGDAGLIRGAYHFARPDLSGAAEQAAHFVDHGGNWTADGRTLPPALDLEHNPYGPDACYGRGQSDMVSWIREFSDAVKARTGRAPALYTTSDWWTRCTGGDTGFGGTNPLWVARYATSPGTLPAGWSAHTFWQYADSGTFPGDQNWFNGSYDELKAFARG